MNIDKNKEENMKGRNTEREMLEIFELGKEIIKSKGMFREKWKRGRRKIREGDGRERERERERERKKKEEREKEERRERERI